MSHASRHFPGGMVYHVLNRGVSRRTLFDKDQDWRSRGSSKRRCAPAGCEFAPLACLPIIGTRSFGAHPAFPILCPWPLPRPSDWLEIVNCPQSEAELEALRRCVQRGSPFGSIDWTAMIAKQLKIESSLRARGRPRKEP